MPKKTKRGTDLYAKLLGFKEFLKSVEKDRLKEFLKQDAQYFDKVLPYASRYMERQIKRIGYTPTNLVFGRVFRIQF